jgi:hypothetical protein
LAEGTNGEICAGDLKKPKANGEIYLECNSMETKPGRNFLWILTLNYDYTIIISGATVQTSSFFRIARGLTRTQVSATMRGVVARCTDRNPVLLRVVGVSAEFFVGFATLTHVR